MRWFFLLLMAAALAAADLHPSRSEEQIDKSSTVRSADTNQDGKIDLEEYHLRLTEVFYLIDVDKDGYLTLEEIQESVEEARSDRIRAADSDGDGKLSLSEYHSALDEDFHAADANKDGMLSSHEIDLMLETR
jgi:Ca2+-binding EF-hand superfamily protein